MLHKHLLARLCKARTLLQRADGDTPSVQGVADAVGISHFHFIRLYKSVFGETPNQCQIRARMEKTKKLLLTTDYSVTRICMEVGSSSLGSFTTAFIRHVGQSPGAFRRSYRPQQHEPDQMPRSLIPGCFALMPGKRR